MNRKLLTALVFSMFTTAALAQEPAPAPAAPPAPPPTAPAPAAAPAPEPAPPAPPAPAAAPAPAPAPGKKTLLQTLGKGEGEPPAPPPPGPAPDSPEAKELAAAEKDTRRPKDVPAKYWSAEKGEVNYAAWAKSTSDLETRMRTVGLPPKSADEYKLEVPKEMKDLGFDLDPAQAKGFRAMSHELGLTQKQYEGVMGAYLKNIGALANQASAFSEQRARTDLLAHYKTEEGMTKAVQRAYRAFSAFATEQDMELLDTLGNIPAVIRILDKVGAEMGEDPGVHPDAILDQESLATLMRGKPGAEDSPYWNTNDPRHAATMAKVQAHHEAQARSRQRKQAA